MLSAVDRNVVTCKWEQCELKGKTELLLCLIIWE